MINRGIYSGGEQGVSLAECTAALLLIGLAALSGLELVALTVVTGDRLQRHAAANCLLAGRLEERLALPYDDPALDPGGSLDDPRPGYAEELTLDGRPWQVLCLVSQEAGGRKLVTLRLAPAGGGPGARLSAWVVR